MRLLLLFLLSAGVLGPSLSRAQSGATTAPNRGAALPDSVQLDQLRDQVTQQAEAGRFALAQRALHQADSLARHSGQPRFRAGVALSAGYLANALGDYPQGLAHYQQALALARRLGNYPRQVRALVRLGTTSVQADNLPAAGRYLQQALALARRHRLRTPAADVLGELANLADRRHQPAQALAYNAQALAIYQADHNWDQYYIGLLNQGIHLKNLGRYAEAEAAERRVLAYAQQQHDAYLQAYAQMNLPNALLPQHRPAEAEAYARQALTWLRRVPQPGGFHEMYDVLSRVKEQQGQPGPALTYYRLATAYNDTLRNAEQHRQLLQTEARYQSREQQTQIRHLDQLTTQQTRQLWALGLGLLLTTGLLAGNVGQYRALRRTNGQLHARNAQVREQASRLALLLKELHHRVKNNLAIISSLLYMQASRLQDNRAAQAVREGQQRVDAMSLIHQRLYQTDLITAIDLPRYVAELTEGLLAAYGFDPAAMDLRLAVTQPTLDVEVAIPLGLILNEMLTNACKHAYQHVARPLLALTLGPTAAGDLVLEVRDNGPGFEAAALPTSSFGQQLIQVLSEQLGADLTLDTRAGTCYQLRIPLPMRQANEKA